MNVNVLKRLCFGAKTESAGTAILVTIPGEEGWIANLQRIICTTGSTAHTLIVYRPAESALTSESCLAAGTSLKVPASGFFNSTIAANDYVIIRTSEGKWVTRKVTAVSVAAGVNTLTIAAPGVDIDEGALVYGYDVSLTDHLTFPLAASTTNTYEDEIGFAFGEAGEPLLCSINNATNASTIKAMNVVYTSV